MAKTFETTYQGRQIRVENRWFGGEKLFVDGQLQDEQLGLTFRGTLTGMVEDNQGERKSIKVSVGGTFKIECKIFVDNELIYPE